MGIGPSSSRKGGTAPKFWAMSNCGQSAWWIKTPLGMEVGLGPGDIVLDGGPALPPERGTSPKFSADVYCGKTVAHLRCCLVLVFTARRNARIASAVLAIAIPSVCHRSVCLSVCLSVTRRYCVKTTACSTVQFAVSDGKICPVF